MKYSIGFRASVVKKVQDGSGKSVLQVSKDTGVSVATINRWIQQFKSGTISLDGCDSLTPSQRNPGEKLSLLLESKTLPIEKRGEWLRQNGIHSEHLPLWEQELTSIMTDKQTDLNQENILLRKENKRLEKELARKEKALAETAVLLTLKKKYHNLFEDDGEI